MRNVIFAFRNLAIAAYRLAWFHVRRKLGIVQ